jgi:hypothetical protein
MPLATSLQRSLGLVFAGTFLTLAGSVQAVDPAAGRAGGLVPAGESTRGGMTREELFREWDLDGDGTISKSEADVARGRMRKRRIEMQLQAGIDPLTGKPLELDRGEADVATEPGQEPEFRLPPEPPPAPRSNKPENGLPGMRSPAPPRPTTPASGLPAATVPGEPKASRTEPAAPSRPAVSSRASWLPPHTQPPALTGGIRAGAPAAVPGYGAGPWADLNAGRRPAPTAAAPGTASSQPAAGGGLLPSTRPPGRTGALILPTVPGRTTLPAPAPRPTTPPLVPKSRITAEEIGGYGP